MTTRYIAPVLAALLSSSVSGAPDKTEEALANEPAVVWLPGMNIEAFWLQYADSKGGLTWGKSSSYPDYDKVKEGDTLLIELEQGPCLMEFFHSRWRRANDVWRWDDSINAYGGCPHVFE